MVRVDALKQQKPDLFMATKEVSKVTATQVQEQCVLMLASDT